MKIICIGDSITWGFPFGPEYSWVYQLKKTLAAEVINKGINGNTTSQMRMRFERDVVKQRPSHVVIMGGANDVILADSRDRILDNFRNMTERAMNSGIKVILGLPTPFDDDYYENLLSRIRNWLIKYAEENNIETIDFNAGFYDGKGMLRGELLLADGGHPSLLGYQEMFKQINPDIFKD